MPSERDGHAEPLRVEDDDALLDDADELVPEDLCVADDVASAHIVAVRLRGHAGSLRKVAPVEWEVSRRGRGRAAGKHSRGGSEERGE